MVENIIEYLVGESIINLFYRLTDTRSDAEKYGVMPKISTQGALSACRIDLKNKTIPAPHQSFKAITIEFRAYLSDVVNSNLFGRYTYALALLIAFENQTKNQFKVNRE